jgi:hypothetical protein
VNVTCLGTVTSIWKFKFDYFSGGELLAVPIAGILHFPQYLEAFYGMFQMSHFFSNPALIPTRSTLKNWPNIADSVCT